MNKFKLIKLSLIGTSKNYDVNFRSGLNYISGPTSTGKTSILEMVDYALGSKSHKSYIEIGEQCNSVELEIMIEEYRYKISRKLFDFKAAVIVLKWSDEKEKYDFYKRCDIDSPKNEDSLSAFLVEHLGIPEIKISNQNFSFRDLFKYSYLKQTEIDNENILGENDWVKNNKRKATFEVIFNVYDKMLGDLKDSKKKKEEELKELRTKFSGVSEFLSSTNHVDPITYIKNRTEVEGDIKKLKDELREIKNEDGFENDVTEELRKKVVINKNSFTSILENIADQTKYIEKLNMLINQYISEVERKELALEGYKVLNKYEFLFCPNCLKPLKVPENQDTCYLCGSEKGNEVDEILVLKKEVAQIRRKTTELRKFIKVEEEKLSALCSNKIIIEKEINEQEDELNHLYANYENPQMEHIEFLNYEIGKATRKLNEIDNYLQVVDEVNRLEGIIKDKVGTIDEIKKSIKEAEEQQVSKDEVLSNLSTEFYSILETFGFPKLSDAYISNKKYLPVVRGVDYNQLGSLAGVTLITMAYYLSVLVEACKNDGNHLNVLIMDSPRKNLGAKADDADFRDEEIFNNIIRTLINIDKEYSDKIQLVVVNNGYPDFFDSKYIIKEFSSDGSRGLIDNI